MSVLINVFLCVREKKINTTNDVNEENRIKVTYVEREKETDDVGIICVIIYDDLALKAWTQRRERREEKRINITDGGRKTYLRNNASKFCRL